MFYLIWFRKIEVLLSLNLKKTIEIATIFLNMHVLNFYQQHYKLNL